MLLFRAGTKPPRQTDLLREAASRAARTLAIRRRVFRHLPGRDRRTWTGVLFDRRRAWVGQQVLLPDGSPAWIKRVQGGLACVRTMATDPSDGAVHQYLEATALRRYRLPEAVLLASLKRGVKEVASALKAASNRANGSLAVRPGSRPRGRPRKKRSSPSAPAGGGLPAPGADQRRS